MTGEKGFKRSEAADGNSACGLSCMGKEIYAVNAIMLYAVFGVRCSVFGVRCSVFGVRCSVFGVRSRIVPGEFYVSRGFLRKC